MRKLDPRSLAVDLLRRSICNVQVAAVIYDKYGIMSWGWNHVSSGLGMHAEAHAISRANRSRLKGASIAIAGKRRSAVVPSLPCENCLMKLKAAGITQVSIQNRHGDWIQYHYRIVPVSTAAIWLRV